MSQHVDAEVALEPEPALHPDLDLHDPPQLPRPLERQLPQPLSLTTRLAPELVRERSRHPRQISDRGHPQPPPPRCAPVAPRRKSSNPRRVPAGSATTLSSPNGVRSRARLAPKRLLVDDEAPPVGAAGLELVQRFSQPRDVVGPHGGTDVHAAGDLVGAADHPRQAADQHVADVVAM